MKKIFFLLLVAVSITTSAQIQKNNKSQLTIEQIMQEPDKWIGMSPENISWDEQGKQIYFDWNPERDTLSSLYSFSLKDSKIAKVTVEEKQKMPGRYLAYNSGKTKGVFIKNGNIFVMNIEDGTVKQLTNWLEQASSPRFVLNDTEISFLKSNNLFCINPETGLIRQITNFVAGDEKPEQKAKGQELFLENQQIELFDVLKNKAATEKAREYRNSLEETKEPLKIYLGKKRLGGVALSASGKYAIFTTFLSAQGGRQTSVTHYVTESGFTEEIQGRTKVGSPQSEVEMAIFDIGNNKIIKIKTDQIPGLKDMPDYLKDYPEKMPKDSSEIKDRPVNIMGPVWNETKDLALVAALSRDNKDRWILLLDPATGNLENLDRQRDEAWIGGPGIGGWGMSVGDAGWMPDGKSMWFQSEASGYSHIYTVNTETKEKKTLTSGKFEVSDPFISKDKKWFYFTANKVHPGVSHFYRMPVWGGELTQLTSMDGGNEVTLSPDEKTLAIRFSTGNKPWELYLQENKADAEAKKITHSTTPEFEKYPWRTPEYITFKAEDGATVYARLYRPVNQQKQGPAVIFVHGAGYLQNAHKWWSSYFREYQFHNFLADNGYTVLDIDYRGSAGYGRDWRTGIYRHMGGKDLSDHVDGAKYLVEKCGVSAQKIGLYGGSYGGFITLMAMFNNPETFAAGAALRSVTDWAHYNHGYTANILNTPVEDSIAYRQSSPIYFAVGLQGALLMCHGMVDDNVQFQDIVRLTQRLIELGKENWELAVYPVESHSFTEPTSWTDEYKRIFKLFEENLKK